MSIFVWLIPHKEKTKHLTIYKTTVVWQKSKEQLSSIQSIARVVEYALHLALQRRSVYRLK